MRYLTREKAAKDFVYDIIYRRACVEVSLFDGFRLKTVINGRHADDKYGDLGASISADFRFDYIKEWVEYDPYGGRISIDGKRFIELMPVCKKYYNPKERAEAQRKGLVNRLIAGGHGRSTAGYVTVSEKNGNLFLARQETRKAKIQTEITNFQHTSAELQRIGFSTAHAPLLPPDMKH